MSMSWERVRKLEALANGSPNPYEATQARELAVRLRQKLPPEKPEKPVSAAPAQFEMKFAFRVRRWHRKKTLQILADVGQRVSFLNRWTVTEEEQTLWSSRFKVHASGEENHLRLTCVYLFCNGTQSLREALSKVRTRCVTMNV